MGVQVGAGHTAVQHLRNSRKRVGLSDYIQMKCAWVVFLQCDRHFDDSTLMCEDTVLLDMVVSGETMHSDTPPGLF